MSEACASLHSWTQSNVEHSGLACVTLRRTPIEFESVSGSLGSLVAGCVLAPEGPGLREWRSGYRLPIAREPPTATIL
jgi:hypothetical protein